MNEEEIDEFARLMLARRELDSEYQESRDTLIDELNSRSTLIGDSYLIEKNNYTRRNLDPRKIKAEFNLTDEDLEQFKTRENVKSFNVIDQSTGKIL